MRAPAILLCIGAIVLAGCASYRWGLADTDGPAIRSIRVIAVENNTLAPQFEALFERELRNTLSRELGLRLREDRSADAEISVEITRYQRDPAARQSADTRLPASFDIEIAALVRVVSPTTGATLAERTVTASEHAYSETDLPQVEYQLMPDLARLLARRAAHVVVDRR